MDNIKLTSIIPFEQNNIIFLMKDNEAKEILKLYENGDIFVKGILAENKKIITTKLNTK